MTVQVLLLLVLLCATSHVAYPSLTDDKFAFTKMVKAVAVLSINKGVTGTLYFEQQGNGPTTVTGNVSGLKPGLHGFHVHALGNITNGCMSTGPHFNPKGKQHGAPYDENRHAGDLGNLIVGANGSVNVAITDKQIPLTGSNSIVGRAIVVHADPDDLGRGGHELSKITGNSGARIACGCYCIPWTSFFGKASDAPLVSRNLQLCREAVFTASVAAAYN